MGEGKDGGAEAGGAVFWGLPADDPRRLQKRRAEALGRVVLGVDDLLAEGVALSREHLLRLVAEQVRRSLPSPPAYDLDHDVVLQEAVRLLAEGLVAAPRTGTAARLPQPDEPVVREPVRRR